MRRAISFLRRKRGDGFAVGLALLMMTAVCVLGWWQSDYRPRFVIEDYRPYQAAAFSPDGRWMYWIDLDNRVHLWDIAKGTQRSLKDPELPQGKVCISSDSTLLVADNWPEPSKYWDVGTGELIDFGRETTKGSFMGTSLDGQNLLLLSLPNDDASSILVVNRKTGAVAARLTNALGPVMFAPNQRRLITGYEKYGGQGSPETCHWLWDTRTWQAAGDRDLFEDWFNPLSFSADSSLLACEARRSGQMELVVVDLDKRRIRAALPYRVVHNRPVPFFSEDNRYLMVYGLNADNQEALAIWDLAADPPRLAHEVAKAVVAANGRFAARLLPEITSDGTGFIEILTLPGVKRQAIVALPRINLEHVSDPVSSLEAFCCSMSFEPNARCLAVHVHGYSRRYDLRPLELLRACWNCFVGGNTFPFDFESVHSVRIYDTNTGRELHVLHAQQNPFFSPDGRTLTTSDNGRLAVWDLPPRKPWNLILAWSALAGLVTLLLCLLVQVWWARRRKLSPALGGRQLPLAG